MKEKRRPSAATPKGLQKKSYTSEKRRNEGAGVIFGPRTVTPEGEMGTPKEKRKKRRR